MRITLYLLLCILTRMPVASQTNLETADSLYSVRANGYQASSGLADPLVINQAIAAYESAVIESDCQERVELIWKLMQCYYYKGNFTTSDKDKKKAIFRKGIEIGEHALIKHPESPGLHFWMGILWGYWSEQVGLLTAGRKGVANKIKYHAETLIRIEDTFAEGGAYRTLGRLYFKAPRIPLILTWPSKKKALEYFEKAYAINSTNLFTKQYYAEALFDQGRQAEALRLMREITEHHEIIHGIAEDAFIKRETRHFLADHE